LQTTRPTGLDTFAVALAFAFADESARFWQAGP
jgi:hypothetical protein